VANHFGAIGIPIGSMEQFSQLVGALTAEAPRRKIGDGIYDHVWTDPSGARLVSQTRGGGIDFALPCLAGAGAPAPVRNIRLIDPETAMLDLLDTVDGNMVCPLAVELEDRAVLAARGGTLHTGQLVLAALAEKITVHADADAYYASQPGDGPKFAADYLIPAGTFPPSQAPADWAPSAHAILAGEVLQARTRTTERTGGQFHWIRVRTIAGTELDIAANPEDLPDLPTPGNIASGTFFLTGNLGLNLADPIDPPADAPAEKRRWRRR
jgi:hypothetical protein